MRVKAFESLVRSENSALRHLRRARYKKGRVFCHACNGRIVYRLAEGRYRCARCRHTFGPLTGTWIAQSRVGLTTWLWLVKLFELEVTAHQAALQAGVSYPTALRVFTTIRRAILAGEELSVFRREVEADESYFGGRRKGPRGRGAAGKVPVFGILERHGRVKVTVVPNVTARTLLNETVKMVKRGTLVYTDKFGGYDALAFCGYRHLKVDHGKRFARGRVHINGLEGFWSYAKGKLYKHHGVSPEKFPLYLYEMQFRYNHRREDLFEMFLDALVKPVPTV
ncbi:MAG: IS1595 family transposase [Nitrospinae bacterium]|nr:IS1595 family transposase [Nitrospinota bacterium]